MLFGALQLATSDCRPSIATGVAGANRTRDCTALGARVRNKQTHIELHGMHINVTLWTFDCKYTNYKFLIAHSQTSSKCHENKYTCIRKFRHITTCIRVVIFHIKFYIFIIGKLALTQLLTRNCQRLSDKWLVLIKFNRILMYSILWPSLRQPDPVECGSMQAVSSRQVCE